jgi:hypothetical protein
VILELVVATAVALSGSCDVMPSLFGPASGETIMLARHTGATTLVQAAMGSPFPTGVSEVRAYEFVVATASIVEGRFQAWGVVAPGDRVWLVPWDRDAGCRLVPHERVDWVPPDSLALFRVTAARRHLGVPVIDIATPPSGYPYVDPESVVQGNQAPRRGEWITADDLYSLLVAAPRPGDATPRAEQLRRVENAYRGGPTYLMSRFPGPQLLEQYRKWAGVGPGS